MFIKPSSQSGTRILLPGLAIALLYTAFFAFPRLREQERIALATTRKSAEVDELLKRRRKQQAELTQIQAQTETEQRNVISTRQTAYAISERSTVREFAQLLAIFEAEQVVCTSAEADNTQIVDGRSRLTQASNGSPPKGHPAGSPQFAAGTKLLPSRNRSISPDGPAHTLSLTGEFYSVLSALESIESALPFALATEFSMERSDPSQVCRWKIVLQLAP